MLSSQAQQDTLVLAPAVSIYERADDHNQLQSGLDSLHLLQFVDADLGDYIGKRTTSNVLQYGPPGSTVSVRQGGLAADHFSVAWHGLSLNSITLGQADLSLFPLFLFDGSTLYHTTNAANFPGSTFAGGLLLKTERAKKNRFHGFMSYNSLNNRSVGLGGNYVKNKWSLSTRVIWRQLNNEFSYNDSYKFNEPLEEQVHNNTGQLAFLQSVSYQFTKRLRVFAEGWYQAKTTEVPRIMGSYGQSDALQNDSTTRIVGGIEHVGLRHKMVLRLGHNDEKQVYRSNLQDDGNYGIDSHIHIQRNYVDFASKWYMIDNLSVELGWQSSLNTAFNTNYNDGRADENRHFGNVGLVAEAFLTTLSINYRQPIADGKATSGAANIQLVRLHVLNRLLNLRMMVQGSRKNRLPDFNEKYWVPGGNAALEPESGWQGDAMLSLEAKIRNWEAVLSAVGSYSSIDNWIQWVPNGAGVFAPENYQHVELFSISPSFSLSKSFRRSRLYWVNQVKLVSTNFEQGSVIGELPYSPRTTIISNLDLWIAGWVGNAGWKYTGERYSNQSNSEAHKLESMHMFSLSVGRVQNVFGQQFSLMLQADNILDVQPEFVRTYASPGRYLGLKLAWNITFDERSK
ncbi:MAG: vitamin B12 transporter [Flavobacteriales bacterium]|jgi:vitamin B12 transporter